MNLRMAISITFEAKRSKYSFRDGPLGNPAPGNVDLDNAAGQAALNVVVERKLVGVRPQADRI